MPAFFETFSPFHSYYYQIRKREETGTFENYFKNYYALVFRIAFSELKSHADADDIVQDVFLKLLLYQPAFESTEHEKAWLLHVSANLSKNRIKYNAVRREEQVEQQHDWI